MSNYLTTNPVFKLAKHDNDLAWRYYFDEEKDLEQELQWIEEEFREEEFREEEFRQRKYKNSNAKTLCKFGEKKNVYARYKSNVKQRIITIIREIELKNLEYTKNLVIILGKYRNIYTKIIIDERDNDNRIHQMEQMEQPKIDNVNDNTECPFLWNNNKEEIEINQNDEIQMAEKQEPIEEIEINQKDEIQIPESKENIKIVTPELIVSKEEEQQKII